MKKGTIGTIIAIAVFALLLVVVLATRESRVSVGVKKIDLSSIDKDKVVALEFSGAKTATLRKEQGTWFVYDPSKGNEKHPADEQIIKSTLDALVTTEVADVVTEKADKHPEYELDDAKGLKVTVRQDGKPPVSVIIGKTAKSGGIYLAETGKSPVFVAQGRFGWMARKDAKGWRKHSIVALKTDEIATVTSRHKDGASFTLKPNGNGGWEIDEPSPPKPPNFRFDPKLAQQVVQSLSSINAQDYLDPGVATDQQLGFAGPHDVVEAKLKDGKTIVAHLGQEVDPQSFAPKESKDGGTPTTARSYKLVPLKVDGDPQVYLIPIYTANTLRKGLEELRDLSLTSFDPQKATRLTIAAGKKVVLKKDQDAWKVVEPKTLPTGLDFDSQQVVYQLDRLHSFKATRMVGGKASDKETGLAKPSGTVEITLDDGKKQVLRFGKELTGPNGQKEVYVKGAVDSELYAMGKDALTQLSTGVDLFKRPPAPPNFPGQGGMRGLESLPPDVRQKIEAQLRQQRHP